MKKILLVSIAFLSFHFAFTQKVEFKVSAPRVVELGERFQISYRLNAKGSEIQFPDFGDISVQGPSTQTSSSVEIINGRMKQSYSYAYVFFAMPRKAGKFVIEPAIVKVDGKIIKSNSFTIEVLGENVIESANENERVEKTARKDVFARISLSKSNVYIGESILATLKFYTRVNLVDVNNLNIPSFTSFWTQDVFSPTQISLERENVNGTIYNAAVIKKLLIFPQKSGKITIDAFELVVVKGKASLFGMQPAGELKLVSNKPVINVKGLPRDEPNSFNGAVGRFSIKSKVDNTKIKANDAIKLDVTISGSGNLKLLSAPDAKFPPQFESFDPKVTENVKSSTAGQSGSKAFQYLIIPREAGTYTLKGIEFSYFDIASKTYKTIKTKDIEVEVEAVEGEQKAYINNNTVIKKDVEILNSDILFIKENTPIFKKKDQYFIATSNYFTILATPLVLFLLVIILLRKRAREMADVSKMRTKKAGKVSRQRLKDAKKLINSDDKEAFFSSIHSALTGYVADKLDIALVDFKKDLFVEKLEEKQLADELIKSYIDLVDRSEFARFAPSQVNENFNDVYKEASKIIDAIERKF